MVTSTGAHQQNLFTFNQESTEVQSSFAIRDQLLVGIRIEECLGLLEGVPFNDCDYLYRRRAANHLSLVTARKKLASRLRHDDAITWSFVFFLSDNGPKRIPIQTAAAPRQDLPDRI